MTNTPVAAPRIVSGGWYAGLLLLVAMQAVTFTELRALGKRVSELAERAATTAALPEAAADASVDLEGLDLEFPRRTLAEVNQFEGGLDGITEPNKLAEALRELDSWAVSAADEREFLAFKQAHVARLRKIVVAQVGSRHEESLRASTGIEGAKLYGQAEELLSLFPTDGDDEKVAAQGRLLVARHSWYGQQLQQRRRLLYNRWALEQVKKALRAKEAEGGLLGDRAKLMQSVAEYLRPIDPAPLEPAVLEMYQFALSESMRRIGREEDRLKFVADVADPSFRRHSPSDH